MINLGSWMNGILIGWGVDPKIANTFDEMIIAALLVILAIGLDYLCQAIFVGSMKKLAQHTHYQWDSLLLKRKVVHHLVHTIPGILVYALLPLAFIRGKGLLLLSQKICAVYIVFALLLAINIQINNLRFELFSVYRVRFVIGDKWFYFSVPRYV